MNKKHLILPLVACLMLAGCTLGKKTNKKKKKSTSGSEISQKSEEDSSLPPEGSSGKSDSSGSSTPTPGGDWSSTEKSNFQTVFHGIVPPYLSVGLDSSKTKLDDGTFVSNAISETAADEYFNSLDTTVWDVGTDSWGFPEAYQDSSDGQGYVWIWLDYDDDDESIYYVTFDWYAYVESLSLSGTYKTEFEVGETFSYEGLIVTITFKDGSTAVIDDKEAIDYYFTVSTPDMTTPGQKTVTVSFEESETKTISATYTINVKSTVKYTVTFDGNGATGGTMDPSQESVGEYTLPVCKFTAPEGKAFAGWKVGGEGETLAAGSSIDLKANTTLVAQWATEHTITLNAGLGSGSMDPIKAGEGGKISEPECTFKAPEGYEFDKWVIGTEPVTFPYTVTGDVEFTATYKEKPVSTDITISKASIESHGPFNPYPSAAFDFEADGVSFSASKDVGIKKANTDGGNYFFEQGAIQMKRDGAGIITVKEATQAKTITVHWMATYEEEGSDYHPVIKVGSSVSAISTSIPCNEGTTVKGVDSGSQEKGGDGKDYKAYNYTTTYTIPAGNPFFSISSGKGALYVKDIVITL